MNKIVLIPLLLYLSLFCFSSLQATSYEPTIVNYNNIDYSGVSKNGNSFTYYFYTKVADTFSFDFSCYAAGNTWGYSCIYIKIDDEYLVYLSDPKGASGSYTYLSDKEGFHTLCGYYYAENANCSGSYCHIENIKLTHFYEPTVSKPDCYSTVGDDTTNRQYNNIGSNTYSTYQAIYTPSEVGFSGTISEIAFQRVDATTDSRSISVYMGHKNESTFSSTTDYLPFSDMTLVYSGTKTDANFDSGWDVIKLNTPFEYDGERNLVVIVCHTRYDKKVCYYHCSITTDKVLFRCDNSSNGTGTTACDPSNNSSWSYSKSDYRANIRFTINKGVIIGYHYTGNGITYALYEDKTARLVDGIGYIGKELTIPASIESNGIQYLVTTICKNAFSGNKAINSIEIASSVTFIDSFAFQSCTGLGEVILKDGINGIEIDKSAFEGTSLLSVYIGRNVVGSCFSNIASLEDVRFGSIVYYIPTCGFQNCNRIAKISIENIEYISASAFENCVGLQEVSTGNNLQYIGTYSFANCANLQNFHVQFETPLEIDSTVFFSNNNEDAILHVPTGTVNLFRETEVWKDFGTIVDIAPVKIQYTSLDGSIVEPNDLEAFDSDVIYNRYSNNDKGTILLGGELTTIGRSAFAECSTLVSAVLPECVIKIDRYGFQDCETLESIVLPATIKVVDKYAFLGCESLENVSVYALVPPTLYSNSFEYYGTLHVMQGYKKIYQAADHWKNFYIVDDLIIEEGTLFTDGLAHTERRPKDIEKMIYTRTFSNDKWQALYVPFSIPVDTLTQYGLEVAELNNVHMYDTDGDKKFDKTTLEFLYLTDDATQANYPYLIKAANAGEVKLNLKNVELKAAAETQIECSTTRQTFKIKGTYAGVSGTDMYNNNYYAMGGGSLVRVENAESGLKPQRWYLSIENKNGTPIEYYAPKMRIMVNGFEIDEEENETGIREISAKMEEGTIYSLDGCVMNQSGVLKSGIYVKNGQKMIVR